MTKFAIVAVLGLSLAAPVAAEDSGGGWTVQTTPFGTTVSNADKNISFKAPDAKAGQEMASILKQKRWTDWTPFTYPFNLTQQPAATIPCGFTKQGLPVGLQIVGPRYADALVLRAARAFETARPITLPAM